MFDVIVFGGSTRDFFYVSSKYRIKADRLELIWGEKIVADSLYKEVGGGGCNAAVGFSRLGLKTALFSQVGDDASGEEIAKTLKREGIDPAYLKVKPNGLTSSSAILAAESGEHTIVMYRGKNDQLIDNQVDWKGLRNTRWLYVADMAAEGKDPCLELARLADNFGIKLAFVPGQHQLQCGIDPLRPILAETEILILNGYEACEILAESHTEATEEMISKMLKKFLSLGVKIAVITRDVQGVAVGEGDRVIFEPAPDVPVVTDTTGAGDAFAAGFVGARLLGQDIGTAIRWGTLNSGSVIRRYGAQTGLLRIERLSQRTKN